MPTLEEVTAQAQLLSREEQVALANELLAVVEYLDPEVEAVWDEEIQARIAAHEKEPLPSYSFDEIVAKYRVT